MQGAATVTQGGVGRIEGHPLKLRANCNALANFNAGEGIVNPTAKTLKFSVTLGVSTFYLLSEVGSSQASTAQLALKDNPHKLVVRAEDLLWNDSRRRSSEGSGREYVIDVAPRAIALKSSDRPQSMLNLPNVELACN